MTVNGIVGSDLVAPINRPEDPWKTWSIDEIWMGEGPGEGKFVPKINDYVRRPSTYETWIVDHLDPVTLKPTLRFIRPAPYASDLTPEQVIYGADNSQSKVWLAYLNDSVMPHVLEIDKRYFVGGTMLTYAKIFLGSDTNAETGRVISKMFDNTGAYIGDKVPLEMVALNSHDNYALKTVKRCNITEKLPNNELLTVVFYTDDGVVANRQQFLVMNTDAMADVNKQSRYVTGISLKSNFMSPVTPDLLEMPLNIQMDSLQLYATVHYTDGDLELPVDGVKFKMPGLESVLSSIPGQPIPLVLTYDLSDDETGYAIGGIGTRKIVRPYLLRTTNRDDGIAVKLFGYPVWMGEANGYVMKFWLVNMERSQFFDATPYVNFNENFGAYDPKNYGYVQHRSVSVNLRQVSPTFAPFIHTQLIDITLMGTPPNTQDAWIVKTAGPNSNDYGRDLVARFRPGGAINLKSQFADYADWLANYYSFIDPMVNESVETKPPTPTHFIIHAKGETTEWAIEDYWDKDIQVSQNLAVYDTVMIQFIRRVGPVTQQLGFGAAVVRL